MSEHENCHVEPVEKAFEETALNGAMAAYFNVSGMGCPRCATRVQNGLLTQEGVVLADVFLEQAAAAVAYDPKQVSPEQLLEAVSGAGNDGKHHYAAELMVVKPINEALELSGDQRTWS